MTTLATSLISFLSLGCSVFGYRSEETPRYEVLEKKDSFEIRKYQPYLAAQTEVEGDFEEAQGKAFRILAKFIFGENQSQEKLAMTAPVVKERKSEKMAMTAPVT
ncbi:MAG: SOUL family heme-binding protein, partial [Bdellovibrionales bacterium]